jgi:hypothetical protein
MSDEGTGLAMGELIKIILVSIVVVAFFVGCVPSVKNMFDDVNALKNFKGMYEYLTDSNSGLPINNMGTYMPFITKNSAIIFWDRESSDEIIIKTFHFSNDNFKRKFVKPLDDKNCISNSCMCYYADYQSDKGLGRINTCYTLNVRINGSFVLPMELIKKYNSPLQKKFLFINTGGEKGELKNLDLTSQSSVDSVYSYTGNGAVIFDVGINNKLGDKKEIALKFFVNENKEMMICLDDGVCTKLQNELISNS